MILVDVAREDASVIVSDLKELEIHKCGSIAIESSETHISELVDEAERRAPGDPGDAVVWEEVEARTSEDSRLTASFVIFMILAALIATIGISRTPRSSSSARWSSGPSSARSPGSASPSSSAG